MMGLGTWAVRFSRRHNSLGSGYLVFSVCPEGVLLLRIPSEGCMSVLVLGDSPPIMK